MTPSHRRPLPSKTIVKEVAETQAATLVGYIKKYTISQDVLRSDPTKMAKLLATHQASTHSNIIKELNPHDSRIGDVDHLLEDYNKVLRQEPVSYEDHFVHYHYAFSASLLYNTHKVCPHFRKWDNFKPIFDRRLAELEDAFLRSHYARAAAPALLPVQVPRQLASGAVSAVFLTKASADDLLRNLFSLMDQVFMHKPGTKDACRWKVASFTMKDSKQTEYGVLFADCDCPLLMEHNEIVNLMMESSQIATM